MCFGKYEMQEYMLIKYVLEYDMHMSYLVNKLKT
jgi:hypothetical protein